MTANIVPSSQQGAVGAPLPGGPPAWGAPDVAPDSSASIWARVTRTLAALRRYLWLIIAIVAVGTGAGVYLSRTVNPKYQVGGSIWITARPGVTGPISSAGLVSDQLSWVDLAQSNLVLDAVASELALYVDPDNPRDSLLVRSLLPTDSLQTGPFRLDVDQVGANWTLTRLPTRPGEPPSVVERGAVGDSIGRSAGFRWDPPVQELAPSRSVSFFVVTPREASNALAQRLAVTPPGRNGNLMRLRLTGEKPARLAATLNAILHHFIDEAARLKRDNLTEQAKTVARQLDSASARLQLAQDSYESFRINTATLPSDATAIAPGASLTLNPVMNEYFQSKVSLQGITRDREALARLLSDSALTANGGKVSIEGLKALPQVVAANAGLRTEIGNLESKQSTLRALLLTYTDSFRTVVRLKDDINVLETQTIPMLARQSLVELQTQEAEMNRRIDAQSASIRSIPERAVREAALKREMDVAQDLYVNLSRRTEEARLAALSAMPDVQILDPAVAPQRPSQDTAPSILLAAIAASVAVALVIAVLLDLIDKRFRYPEQATRELGLDIMGAIPTVTNPKNSSARLQEASQLVESFRSLALTVRSAFDGMGPVQLTVSSPGPGDGKSFISANLASALADSGFRTILVDGDIRRGALHNVFSPMEMVPGLLDYLTGGAALGEVIRSTSHGNLFVIPGGTRRRHGPELLSGEGMAGLLRELRTQFDAVLVDSAPLGAGIDPFALGVATGAMMIVLRSGETDRKLAQAKLEVLDRMPVRILGTVLNDIGGTPQFRYYYYYFDGYGSLENATDGTALIGSGANGSRS